MVRNIEQKTKHTARSTQAEKQVETKDIHTRHRLIKEANRQWRCVRETRLWDDPMIDFFFLDRSKSCRDSGPFLIHWTSGKFDDESNLRVLASLVSMSFELLRRLRSRVLFLDASFDQQYIKETCFEIWSSKVHLLECTRGHCNWRICNWSCTTELTYNHISTLGELNSCELGVFRF